MPWRGDWIRVWWRVATLTRNRRLHWTDTRAGARAELVARYMADRAKHPAGSQLIVAYRNADARSLNDAVRDARRAAGELAHPAVLIGGRDYAASDRIVFLSNDHQGHQVANLDRGAQASDVKNGTLGTIEHATPERLTVRLDDGRAVAFHPGVYKGIAHAVHAIERALDLARGLGLGR